MEIYHYPPDGNNPDCWVLLMDDQQPYPDTHWNPCGVKYGRAKYLSENGLEVEAFARQNNVAIQEG